jgi:hypothetical protein
LPRCVWYYHAHILHIRFQPRWDTSRTSGFSLAKTRLYVRFGSTRSYLACGQGGSVITAKNPLRCYSQQMKLIRWFGKRKMPQVHPGFSLAQLIETTANELRAVRDRAPDDTVIQLTDCELELAVTVGAEAGGGIKFWVVDTSAKGNLESVSRVTLKFGPVPGKPGIAARAGEQTSGTDPDPNVLEGDDSSGDGS